MRAQTQLCLEEEVVGSLLDEKKRPAGVAKVRKNDPRHIIGTWTSVENDISSSNNAVRHLNQPTLMVVKKMQPF